MTYFNRPLTIWGEESQVDKRDNGIDILSLSDSKQSHPLFTSVAFASLASTQTIRLAKRHCGL